MSNIKVTINPNNTNNPFCHETMQMLKVTVVVRRCFSLEQSYF